MIILNPDFKKYDNNQKNKITLAELESRAQAEMRNDDPNKMVPLPPPKEIPDSCLIKCPGYWWLVSSIDKRWKAEGKSDEVGGVDMCGEARIAFMQLKDRLGDKVPWDLVYKFEPRDLKKFKLASDPDNLNKKR